MLSREEKLEKLNSIYAKSLDTIDRNLGKDKEQVYAGCQALQTVSREMVVLERVMSMLGESKRTEKRVLGWDEVKPNSEPTATA